MVERNWDKPVENRLNNATTQKMSNFSGFSRAPQREEEHHLTFLVIEACSTRTCDLETTTANETPS